MFRLAFGSERRRSISLPMLQTIVEGRIAEIGECPPGPRGIEGPVAVVRHRPAALTAFHVPGELLRDLAEAVHRARSDIEHAGAASIEHPGSQFGDVADVDVVAPLLALAEEDDLLAFGGKPPEAGQTV